MTSQEAFQFVRIAKMVRDIGKRVAKVENREIFVGLDGHYGSPGERVESKVFREIFQQSNCERIFSTRVLIDRFCIVLNFQSEGTAGIQGQYMLLQFSHQDLLMPKRLSIFSLPLLETTCLHITL